MKKIMILLILLFILSGCSENQDNNLKNQNNSQFQPSYDKVIVAYGDSLTQGYGVERKFSYPSQLQEELDNLGYNVKIHNSGLSGETTTGALNRIDWVLQLNPDIVILTTGGNDAIRGLNINITKENIIQIIQILKENNVTVILSGMQIYENLGEEYTTNFKQLYFDIQEQQNVSFIPFFLEGVAGNTSLNIDDRIHPNKEGYKKIVKNNILPILLQILNEK